MWYSIKQLLRKNKLLFSLKLRHSSKEYQENKLAMRHAKKSPEVIRREMALIRKYWSCPPDHYIRYGLYDIELDEEALLDYIPPYYFYARNLDVKQCNFNKFEMSDKIVQIKLFAEKAIPMPQTVALYRNGKLTGFDGEEVSMEQLIRRHLTKDGDKLFIKPADGAGGRGIFVLKRRDGQLWLDKQTVEENEVLPALSRKKNYLVQVGLKQREDMSTINPTSINTLRSITQIRNGKAVLCVCVLRIGRNNMDLDNSALGGLSIQVDLETGILGDFATAEHGGGQIYRHPDTGCEFKGRQITGWKEIKARIVELADKLSEFQDLAWDVAITEEGVKIIELNFNYGLDHLQLGCGKGMRKILNVYPDERRN